ncbi:FG-GAP-like repeat-containing protein [Rhizosphaericola mali]|uniref:Insecticide toxin TcdB middle/N-terminal domain-containing protein n=1 Tax=Rhizosphaericola mali TaxID=2545455 RepID=A0A5P2G1V9_9BACT|nr:FG-GAP-like repeat-containing protein [Rhizosphaericola mali]QES88698.1 hypothetical protein E0W69_008550 [Rhizosphaericola mali]
MKIRPLIWLFLVSLLFQIANVSAQTIDLSKPVGSPEGSGDVSPTGGSTYNIPIKILPGINNMQPDINLAYNNQAGDGIAGFGWNLSCMSMITRAGNNYYYNGKATGVNYTNTNDAFLLDGQRLFSTSGNNGANGTTYGTENEQYSKIESFGGTETTGPEWFKVTTKTGTVLEYGHGANTTMATNNIYSTMVWFLNKVTDLNGNYETFTYGLNQTDRTYQLANILYSGNDAMGVSTNINVQFLYNVKQYWETSSKYVGGYDLKDAFTLSNINIIKDGTTIRSYDFAYTQLRQLYLLKSVSEKGSDGNSLNPLIFNYGSNLEAQDVSVPGIRYENMHGGNIYAGDFNGDSKQDLLSVNYSYDQNGMRHDLSYDVLSEFSSYAGSPSVEFFYNYTIPNSTGNNVINVNGRRTRSFGNSIPAGSNNGYLTMDYDGDGKEDALMVRNNFSANGQLICLGVDINYSRYYSIYTGASYITKSYPVPHLPQYTQDFRYTYYSNSTSSYGNNFVSGDFDGDGALDYILILGQTPTTDFKAFFNSPQKGIVNQEILNFVGGDGTTQSIAAARQLLASDFDGDGKQELLVSIENKTNIFSIHPVSAATGYQYACENLGQTLNFYGDEPLFTGDFNGDGKMDIFYRDTKDNSAGSWYVANSTGNPTNPYVSTFFVWANRPYLPQDNGGSAHHIVLGDFNGDGKTDVWQSLDLSSTTSKHNIYYSNGSSFITESYNTSIGNLNGSTTANTVVGDYNGDGKPDILSVNSSNQGTFIYPKPFKEELFLTKATNGLGGQENFSYSLININNNIYSRSWFYQYDDNTNTEVTNLRNGNPYNVYNVPMYVVNQKTKSNGVGSSGLNGISYHYTDASFKKTRGFLGYKSYTQAESSTGLLAGTEQSYSYSVNVLHPTHTYTVLDNDTITDSKVTDTLLRLNPNNVFDKRYVYRNLKTVSYNGATGAASETSNTYDDYGNILASTVKIGSIAAGIVSPIETSVTTISYGIHGTPYPSLPENVTINKTRSGQATINNSTSFTYDTKGNVLSKTDFAGKSKAVTTSNVYDGFGNITQSSISSAGIDSRVSNFTYDNTGRYLLQKEMVGSGISKKTVLTYDNTFGDIASIKAPDGLLTSYTYDAFERKKSTTLPEGYSIDETWSWESSIGRYSLNVTRPGGGSNKKVYYDLLGRVVRTDISGFNDALLTSTAVYDEKGLVTSQTSPHYSSEQTITTTNQYDNLARLTQSTNGTVTSQYAYSKLSAGQFSTTITNGAGQTSTKTEDATGKIITANDNGGTLNYTYNSQGNITQTQLNGSVVTSSVYDEYGKQTSLSDRNAGLTSYEYDGLGQLIKQTDALGKVTSMTYDLFGRTITRTGSEGSTNYEYWSDQANGLSSDNLSKITGFAGDLQEYTYDNLMRLSLQKKTVEGILFTSQYSYDAYSNPIKCVYSTGVSISRTFDHNGIEMQVKLGEGTSATTLFTATAMNSLGYYTAYSKGNGKSSTETYNLATGTPSQYITNDVQNLSFAFDPLNGNLTQRKDQIKNMTEDFNYDNLNRLTSVKLNGVQTQALTYDGSTGNSLGNITEKTDAGKYVYNSTKVNAVAYITNPAGANSPPVTIAQTQQDITYTPFQKTLKVSENEYDLEYSYGSDYQRIKSVLSHSGAITETKYYFGDMERLQSSSGTTKDIHYIPAGNGLCAIVVKTGSTTDVYYTYTDYLGSILTVTNSAGVVVAEQNFDAWGRKRNATTWTYDNITEVPDWLYRGYTGHEHLKEFALINMNGRMYDPVQGRMMSPDNFVPTPLNTQGYNRFGYALNNPLIYNDPDGNIFNLISGVIGGAIGGVWNVVSNLSSGISPLKALEYFGSGFAGGFVTGSTGNYVLGGAITGGINAAIGGGGLKDAILGAASGAASAYIGGKIGEKVGDLLTKVNIPGNFNLPPDGIISNILKTSAGGAVTSTLTGTVQSVADGNGFGDAVADGLKSAGKGAIGGAIGGAVGSGLNSVIRGKNILTGVGKSHTRIILSDLYDGEWLKQMPKENTTSNTNSVITEPGGGKLFVSTSIVNNAKTSSNDVIIVTKDGIALPKGAKIPTEFIENQRRAGDYGFINEGGKFESKVRIDPATPINKKGPNDSHFHLNGEKEHIFDVKRWPWW